MNKLYRCCGIVIALLSATACKKEAASDFDVLPGEIFRIESPSTGTTGSVVRINVFFYGGGSGCATVHHLAPIIKGNITVLKAFYQYPKSKEVTCTAHIPVHKLEYSFEPKSKGKYIFQSQDGAVISVVEVN